MGVFLILLLSLSITTNNQVPQIFINYGVDNQGVELFKFFYDIDDGFYVDIGAYDSIFASNTLNLQIMGWDGINIDASPQRLARFFYARPWQNSLNYAIGEQDTFVTLYQLTQDSSSTISAKVKDYVAFGKPVVQQIKVPSLTLKQLCQRFYYRRPLFLNLDIEGYGPKALSTNDWNNTKCTPDIIFSQINEETYVDSLQLPEMILKKHGYKKWKQNAGLNQIFILQKEYDKYTKKYQQGSKILQQKSIFPLLYLSNLLTSKLSLLPIIFAPHYQPKKQQLYYYFARNKQLIDIDKISKFSNKISQNIKDRPIVICNYNSNNSFIVLKDINYSVANLTVGLIKFYNITVWRTAQQKYSVYVLDQFINPKSNPMIIITQTNQNSNQIKEKQSQKTTEINDNDIQNSKILKNIDTFLNQIINITNQTNKNIQSRIFQLKMAVLSNHRFDQAQLQKILDQIQKLQQKIEDKEQNEQVIQYENQIDIIESLIQQSIRIQLAVLLVILFCLVIINAVICVTQPKQPRQQNNFNNEQFEYNNTKNSRQSSKIVKNYYQNKKQKNIRSDSDSD